MCLGHGGVFVVQPPYLLFYPDRNGDDVPDSDPEVLLTGFGMEDAHAFANSLQWGPDGWLYGAQGSTVNAKIRGIEFVQGIWRYHPLTKEFELFAEGGGNTWGVDFDRHGNLIAGTNFGGNAMLHQVQGAFYVKNFTKHGALKNPHAYGYFGHVPYQGFKGGHVTNGGIIYQGGALPAKYHHQYIAGNLLSNSLYWHILESDGSSFRARFGGDFLLSNDPWFRPVDCLTGPNGAIYVADWHDKRATHLDPIDNWDRSNGRIFRVASKDAKPLPSFNLAKMSSKELVGLLGHQNDWYARKPGAFSPSAATPRCCRDCGRRFSTTKINGAGILVGAVCQWWFQRRAGFEGARRMSMRMCAPGRSACSAMRKRCRRRSANA